MQEGLQSCQRLLLHWGPQPWWQSHWHIILMQCATSTLMKQRGSLAAWVPRKTWKDSLMVAKFGRWLGSPTSIRSAAFADLHTAGSILPSHSSLEILSHKFPDMNRLERPVCRERSKCVIEHCSNIGPLIAGSVSHDISNWAWHSLQWPLMSK